MKDRAYAKINLCLDIAGVRDDGYHELKMIMVPVNFYDVLEMEPAEETSLAVNRSYLPVNEKNTIISAVRVMQEMYGFRTEFACRLSKHIPTRAGLAGGSADAASAIRMMDTMLGLHMSREEKIEAAKRVGSDVPFCMFNEPSYVEGRGDILYPFDVRTPMDILLVKPRRGVSTKEAFALSDSRPLVHPDCLAMRKALMENDYEGVCRNLGNSLEAASLELVSEIRKIKEELQERGFDGVLMSGSGSTVFGLTRSRALLEETMDELRRRHYFVRHTNILTDRSKGL
ncbi:MAG: 4-(cytidine 5'-diphospho)-2-C-methyl-D-erythritol kinase [Solobacterium sp.]|nr:4-(cytidine 5'-diphospho)-2-C-methyl-D-erythritol kinase [Solobacterium sp.]